MKYFNAIFSLILASSSMAQTSEDDIRFQEAKRRLEEKMAVRATTRVATDDPEYLKREIFKLKADLAKKDSEIASLNLKLESLDKELGSVKTMKVDDGKGVKEVLVFSKSNASAEMKLPATTPVQIAVKKGQILEITASGQWAWTEKSVLGYSGSNGPDGEVLDGPKGRIFGALDYKIGTNGIKNTIGTKGKIHITEDGVMTLGMIKPADLNQGYWHPAGSLNVSIKLVSK